MSQLQPQPDVEAEPAARSRPSQLRTVLIGGSLAVVAAAGASQAVIAAGDDHAASRLAPADAFSVLAAPQQPSDVIDNDRARYLVRPESTRLLGESPLGTAYLAVGLTGDACLVTVRGSGLDTGCSTMPTDRDRYVVLTEGPRGEDVALVPDGHQPDEDWRSVSRNLLIKKIN